MANKKLGFYKAAGYSFLEKTIEEMKNVIVPEGTIIYDPTLSRQKHYRLKDGAWIPIGDGGGGETGIKRFDELEDGFTYDLDGSRIVSVGKEGEALKPTFVDELLDRSIQGEEFVNINDPESDPLSRLAIRGDSSIVDYSDGSDIDPSDPHTGRHQIVIQNENEPAVVFIDPKKPLLLAPMNILFSIDILSSPSVSAEEKSYLAGWVFYFFKDTWPTPRKAYLIFYTDTTNTIRLLIGSEIEDPESPLEQDIPFAATGDLYSAGTFDASIKIKNGKLVLAIGRPNSDYIHAQGDICDYDPKKIYNVRPVFEVKHYHGTLDIRLFQYISYSQDASYWIPNLNDKTSKIGSKNLSIDSQSIKSSGKIVRHIEKFGNYLDPEGNAAIDPSAWQDQGSPWSSVSFDPPSLYGDLRLGEFITGTNGRWTARYYGIDPFSDETKGIVASFDSLVGPPPEGFDWFEWLEVDNSHAPVGFSAKNGTIFGELSENNPSGQGLIISPVSASGSGFNKGAIRINPVLLFDTRHQLMLKKTSDFNGDIDIAWNSAVRSLSATAITQVNIKIPDAYEKKAVFLVTTPGSFYVGQEIKVNSVILTMILGIFYDSDIDKYAFKIDISPGLVSNGMIISDLGETEFTAIASEPDIFYPGEPIVGGYVDNANVSEVGVPNFTIRMISIFSPGYNYENDTHITSQAFGTEFEIENLVYIPDDTRYPTYNVGIVMNIYSESKGPLWALIGLHSNFGYQKNNRSVCTMVAWFSGDFPGNQMWVQSELLSIPQNIQDLFYASGRYHLKLNLSKKNLLFSFLSEDGLNTDEIEINRDQLKRVIPDDVNFVEAGIISMPVGICIPKTRVDIVVDIFDVDINLSSKIDGYESINENVEDENRIGNDLGSIVRGKEIGTPRSKMTAKSILSGIVGQVVEPFVSTDQHNDYDLTGWEIVPVNCEFAESTHLSVSAHTYDGYLDTELGFIRPETPFYDDNGNPISGVTMVSMVYSLTEYLGDVLRFGVGVQTEIDGLFFFLSVNNTHINLYVCMQDADSPDKKSISLIASAAPGIQNLSEVALSFSMDSSTGSISAAYKTELSSGTVFSIKVDDYLHLVNFVMEESEKEVISKEYLLENLAPLKPIIGVFSHSTADGSVASSIKAEITRTEIIFGNILSYALIGVSPDNEVIGNPDVTQLRPKTIRYNSDLIEDGVVDIQEQIYEEYDFELGISDFYYLCSLRPQNNIFLWNEEAKKLNAVVASPFFETDKHYSASFLSRKVHMFSGDDIESGTDFFNVDLQSETSDQSATIGHELRLISRDSIIHTEISILFGFVLSGGSLKYSIKFSSSGSIVLSGSVVIPIPDNIDLSVGKLKIALTKDGALSFYAYHTEWVEIHTTTISQFQIILSDRSMSVHAGYFTNDTLYEFGYGSLSRIDFDNLYVDFFGAAKKQGYESHAAKHNVAEIKTLTSDDINSESVTTENLAAENIAAAESIVFNRTIHNLDHPDGLVDGLRGQGEGAVLNDNHNDSNLSPWLVYAIGKGPAIPLTNGSNESGIVALNGSPLSSLSGGDMIVTWPEPGGVSGNCVKLTAASPGKKATLGIVAPINMNGFLPDKTYNVEFYVRNEMTVDGWSAHLVSNYTSGPENRFHTFVSATDIIRSDRWRKYTATVTIPGDAVELHFLFEWEGYPSNFIQLNIPTHEMVDDDRLYIFQSPESQYNGTYKVIKIDDDHLGILIHYLTDETVKYSKTRPYRGYVEGTFGRVYLFESTEGIFGYNQVVVNAPAHGLTASSMILIGKSTVDEYLTWRSNMSEMILDGDHFVLHHSDVSYSSDGTIFWDSPAVQPPEVHIDAIEKYLYQTRIISVGHGFDGGEIIRVLTNSDKYLNVGAVYPAGDYEVVPHYLSPGVKDPDSFRIDVKWKTTPSGSPTITWIPADFGDALTASGSASRFEGTRFYANSKRGNEGIKTVLNKSFLGFLDLGLDPIIEILELYKTEATTEAEIEAPVTEYVIQPSGLKMDNFTITSDVSGVPNPFVETTLLTMTAPADPELIETELRSPIYESTGKLVYQVDFQNLILQGSSEIEVGIEFIGKTDPDDFRRILLRMTNNVPSPPGFETSWSMVILGPSGIIDQESVYDMNYPSSGKFSIQYNTELNEFLVLVDRGSGLAPLPAPLDDAIVSTDLGNWLSPGEYNIRAFFGYLGSSSGVSSAEITRSFIDFEDNRRYFIHQIETKTVIFDDGSKMTSTPGSLPYEEPIKHTTASRDAMISGWGITEGGRKWYNIDTGQWEGWDGTQLIILG